MQSALTALRFTHWCSCSLCAMCVAAVLCAAWANRELALRFFAMRRFTGKNFETPIFRFLNHVSGCAWQPLL